METFLLCSDGLSRRCQAGLEIIIRFIGMEYFIGATYNLRCKGFTFIAAPIVKEAVGLLMLSSLIKQSSQSSWRQHHAGGQEGL